MPLQSKNESIVPSYAVNPEVAAHASAVEDEPQLLVIAVSTAAQQAEQSDVCPHE
jgi:hypothetical protein